MKAEQKTLMLTLNQWICQLQLDVTLVFDGRQKDPAEAIRGHLDQLEVIYTPHHQTADEYILKEIEDSLSPNEETVVSSDRELTGKAKQIGAHTQSIEGFLSFLTKKRKKITVKRARPLCDSPAHIARLRKAFEEKLRCNEED